MACNSFLDVGCSGNLRYKFFLRLKKVDRFCYNKQLNKKSLIKALETYNSAVSIIKLALKAITGERK